MSWTTDDGRHEGYPAHIATDGREAKAGSYNGMHMDTGHYDEHGWTDGEVVPWSALLGWEARCTCGWVGPMWRRPVGSDLQDAAEMVLPEGGTAEDAVLAAWERHVA